MPSGSGAGGSLAARSEVPEQEEERVVRADLSSSGESAPGRLARSGSEDESELSLLGSSLRELTPSATV